MNQKTAVSARGIRKSFGHGSGERIQAIDDVTFSVATGEIVSIVGPSGAGKTTLLRILSGLLRPDEGTVEINGAKVTGVPRGLAVVFQEYNRSLFPWLTIQKNVEFPLRALPRAQRHERALESLRQVGLADVAGLYPWQVSGGMQQRAAIARGIAIRPSVLLLDEPFASVDAQTRVSLEQLTLAISAELGLTVVLITHDIDEAILMSNRVVVMSKRPSVVLREIAVELPWPREDLGTREHPHFAEYRRQVAELIMTPSLVTGEGATQ